MNSYLRTYQTSNIKTVIHAKANINATLAATSPTNKVETQATRIAVTNPIAHFPWRFFRALIKMCRSRVRSRNPIPVTITTNKNIEIF